jgi:hypothetical protein
LLRKVTIAANISARSSMATQSLPVRANNAGFISLTVDRSLLGFADDNEVDHHAEV